MSELKPDPMTLEQLVAWAKTHPCTAGRVPSRHNHSACQAGFAIVDLLGVALPCGWETPFVAGAEVVLVVDDRKFRLGVEEARGIAAALLRASEVAACQHPHADQCSSCKVSRCQHCKTTDGLGTKAATKVWDRGTCAECTEF